MKKSLICVILLSLFAGAYASEFTNGLATGLITNRLQKSWKKRRAIKIKNTAVCPKPCENPFSWENIRDSNKCYPEEAPKKIGLGERIAITLILNIVLWWIYYIFRYGSDKDRDFIIGILVANFIDALLEDE